MKEKHKNANPQPMYLHSQDALVGAQMQTVSQ